jgi:hypothetical protein
MSFNIRYFNWEKIKRMSEENDFQTFDKLIIGPDLCYIEDMISSKVLKEYGKRGKEDRKKLYKKIKDKDKKEVKKLIKKSKNGKQRSKKHKSKS